MNLSNLIGYLAHSEVRGLCRASASGLCGSVTHVVLLRATWGRGEGGEDGGKEDNNNCFEEIKESKKLTVAANQMQD